MANTDIFFAKYGVVLTDWNGVNKIIETAKKAEEEYEKDEYRGLKKLALVHYMIEDWFEAKGETIATYYDESEKSV